MTTGEQEKELPKVEPKAQEQPKVEPQPKVVEKPKRKSLFED